MVLVDTIRQIYQELFTINFFHSAYANGLQTSLADEISLVPDKATQTLFLKYDTGLKFYNDVFICFMRCKLIFPAMPPRAPYVTVANDLQLRFLLKAGEAFMSKTDIQAVGAGQVYHFSNRVNTGTGGYLSHDAADVNDHDLENVSTINPEENCIAVIDIFTGAAMNSSYELFNGPLQQFVSPGYRIDFKSKI